CPVVEKCDRSSSPRPSARRLRNDTAISIAEIFGERVVSRLAGSRAPLVSYGFVLALRNASFKGFAQLRDDRLLRYGRIGGILIISHRISPTFGSRAWGLPSRSLTLPRYAQVRAFVNPARRKNRAVRECSLS